MNYGMVLESYIKANKEKVKQSELNIDAFTFEDEKLLSIRKKIEKNGIMLDNIAKVRCGISKTGFSKETIGYVEDYDKSKYSMYLENSNIGKDVYKVEKLIKRGIMSGEIIDICENQEHLFSTRMTKSIRCVQPDKGILPGKVNVIYDINKDIGIDKLKGYINSKIATAYIVMISPMLNDGFISGDTVTLLKLYVPNNFENPFELTKEEIEYMISKVIK